MLVNPLTSFLDKLPTILVLAVLVGTFLVLRKHTSSARMRLWIGAWALVFLHFFVQAFETQSGTIERIFESVDLAALELSGVVFAVSLTKAAEDRVRRVAMLAILAVPTAFHAFAITFDWHAPWVLASALAFVAAGGAVFALLESNPPVVADFLAAAAFLGTGFWAIRDQLRGSPDFAVNAILTISFGICGFLYWLRYPRRSPGVVVVAGGFLCWGAVFPIANALAYYMPKLTVNPELWNAPKFFVAFGMVLTVVEEKSRIIQGASARERAENRLLSGLALISSRLLAGKDPTALCGEIAAAITDASSFGRAALFVAADRSALHLAGSSGLTAAELEKLRKRSSEWTIETVERMCEEGTPMGTNSFAIGDAEHEILIPLVSCRGSKVGCIWLGGTQGAPSAGHSEMVKLEMFASDLAVTIENARLHHRLVRSEKLAALGQLVAGVAHELNNPLTGIMGYAELLGEEADDESARKRIEKLANEGRRMKRIVDGLLRFARQSNPAARSADLGVALRDVIHLREYHLRKLGIRLEINVEKDLPSVAIGEDELKQVLLNVLNNAIDAVEESARREIRVSASRKGGSVMVQMDDSGPGFPEITRALDPFYTTKPVGKGTGLGLSICYGIMQECGGEISLANKEPYGARVDLEFPAAHVQSDALAHA